MRQLSRCISACRQVCNDGSGDDVRFNHDTFALVAGLHLGLYAWGSQPGRRYGVCSSKDLRTASRSWRCVAPAVAVSFPDQYLNLNGWLKSLGVEARFDVSFGAELTVKGYLEHVTEQARR